MVKAITEYAHVKEDIIRALEEAVGSENLFTGNGVLASYIGTACHGKPPVMPDYVILPRSVDDIRKVLSVANKYKIPITPVVNGIMEPSTVPYAGGIIMDFSRMDKIYEIKPEDGYALVEPGVTVGMLSRDLKKHDYRCSLGSYPPWISVMNYTCRPNTSYRTAIEDDIIGLEVVLPDGTVVRTGSGALPDGEWHSSYGPFPDLHGLFLCAHGMLGLITKLAVRIYPKNEFQACPIAGFDDYKTSMKYSLQLARSNIAEHIIIWHWRLVTGWNQTELEIKRIKSLKDFPQTIAIIGNSDEPPEGLYYNYVTAQMTGFKEEIEARERVCAKLAEKMDGSAYSLDEFGQQYPGMASAWRQEFIDHNPLVGHQRYRSLFGVPGSIVMFLSPTQAVKYERAVREKIMAAGMTFRYYSHLIDQGRSIFIRTGMGIPDLEDKEYVEKYKRLQEEVYLWAAEKYKGVPGRVMETQSASEILGSMGGYTELLKRIKHAIDPKNIMNPGFYRILMKSS